MVYIVCFLSFPRKVFCDRQMADSFFVSLAEHLAKELDGVELDRIITSINSFFAHITVHDKPIASAVKPVAAPVRATSSRASTGGVSKEAKLAEKARINKPGQILNVETNRFRTYPLKGGDKDSLEVYEDLNVCGPAGSPILAAVIAILSGGTVEAASPVAASREKSVPKPRIAKASVQQPIQPPVVSPTPSQTKKPVIDFTEDMDNEDIVSMLKLAGQSAIQKAAKLKKPVVFDIGKLKFQSPGTTTKRINVEFAGYTFSLLEADVKKSWLYAKIMEMLNDKEKDKVEDDDEEGGDAEGDYVDDKAFDATVKGAFSEQEEFTRNEVHAVYNAVFSEDDVEEQFNLVKDDMDREKFDAIKADLDALAKKHGVDEPAQ